MRREAALHVAMGAQRLFDVTSAEATISKLLDARTKKPNMIKSEFRNYRVHQHVPQLNAKCRNQEPSRLVRVRCAYPDLCNKSNNRAHTLLFGSEDLSCGYSGGLGVPLMLNPNMKPPNNSLSYYGDPQKGASSFRKSPKFLEPWTLHRAFAREGCCLKLGDLTRFMV